jgi:hypothetical protein
MKTNPFKPGDWVRIGHDIKDAYRETWHNEGDIEQVSYIAKDGEGLMFASQLGIHFTQVTASLPPNQVGKFFGLCLK